jgi:hypothetical protein
MWQAIYNANGKEKIMALLSLIPGRFWLYGAIVAGLLGFAYHYKHLETEVHQTKAVAVAAQADVKKVDAVAQTTETQSAIIYKQAVLIPAVGDIGLVCKHTGGSALPAPVAVAGTPAGNATPDSTVGPGFDPTGAALTRAKAADAQIAYLQRRVHELETQMNNSP